MNRIKYCVAGSLLAASMLALTGCGSYDVNIRVEPIPAEEVADNMNTIRIHVDADDVGVSVDNGIEVSAGTFAETAEAKEGVSDETLSEAPTLECTPYYYCEDANCEGHTNPDDTCKTATEETEYVDDEEIDYYNLYLTYDRFEDGKLYFIDDGADVDVEFVVALENILGDIEYMEAGDSVLICFNGKFINSNELDTVYYILNNSYAGGFYDDHVENDIDDEENEEDEYSEDNVTSEGLKSSGSALAEEEKAKEEVSVSEDSKEGAASDTNDADALGAVTDIISDALNKPTQTSSKWFH